jgi:hypothetical protein
MKLEVKPQANDMKIRPILNHVISPPVDKIGIFN